MNVSIYIFIYFQEVKTNLEKSHNEPVRKDAPVIKERETCRMFGFSGVEHSHTATDISCKPTAKSCASAESSCAPAENNCADSRRMRRYPGSLRAMKSALIKEGLRHQISVKLKAAGRSPNDILANTPSRDVGLKVRLGG